jgi:hypothetical protein
MPHMSFSLKDFYESKHRKEVLLSFQGHITSEVINTILEDIEIKLDALNEEGKLRKKLYNVLVEALQNLYHHVEDLPDGIYEKVNNKFGIIYISKIENGYIVTSGNFISSNRIKMLKDKLDKINSLSQDELKDMYKFILNHQKLTAKGGGGLGLVDIARKTGNKFEYSFQIVNNDYYFFNLDIIVS